MRFILTSLSRFLPMGLLALLATLCTPAVAQDFLPADQAFRVEASGQAAATVSVQYQVASGTYLYRERMQARWTASGAAPVGVPMSLPEGEKKHDPTFDKVMEVYHHDLQATLKLPQGDGTLTLIYQGCADAGLCYPPQEVRYQVRQAGAAVPQLASLGPAAMSLSPPLADPVGAAPASAPPMPMSAPPVDEGDQITRALSSGRLIQVIQGSAVVTIVLNAVAMWKQEARDRQRGNAPRGAEVHIHVEKLDYIDHACLEMLSSWEKLHQSTGGSLIVEWNELVQRYGRRSQDPAKTEIPALMRRPAA